MLKYVALCAVASLCLACDKPKETPTPEVKASATAAAKASAKPKPKASAKAKPSASAKKRRMPPRPVKYPGHGPVQPTDPPQKQMMTIQYTLAMLAPQPTDPSPDRDAIDAVAKRMSSGGLEAKPEKGHRVLTLNTKRPCSKHVPKTMITTRGSQTLQGMKQLGVNVIKCHGPKFACHQSTGDPKDVLCHAAPRRRRRRRRR